MARRTCGAALLACSVACGGTAEPPRSLGPTVHALTVIVSDAGTVSSAPGGIDCGTVCNASYDDGARLTLMAHPAQAWRFAGWGGACSGSADCVVDLSTDVEVSARFEALPPARHIVALALVGQGRVTSSIGPMDCTAPCSGTFDDGTHVTLTARPAQGWAFSGWSGACSGSGGCALMLSADANVSARFDPLPPPPPAQHALTVVVVGQGRVTSPEGVDCSGTCTTNFSDGTRVTLIATAASGWQFSGWSGACAGAGCVVALTADAAVTASFTQVPPPPPTPISVHISPRTTSVITGGWARFSATIEGTANQQVGWNVTEGDFGGVIDSRGAYTAPATRGTYHLVATSRADPARSATAVVTVTDPPSTLTVTIKPGDISAPSNAKWRFTAQVTGASNTTVTWSVLEGDAGGTIDSAGWCISPMTAGVYHVVATSNADRSVSATAVVRTNTPLIDEGGPVQPVATVYAIWWGSAAVFGGSPTQLAQMFSSLAGTPYLRTLDQYMRGAKASVSFAGNLFDPSSPPSTLFGSLTLGTEICAVLDANRIAPRADGFYVVFIDNLPSGSAGTHDYATCHGIPIRTALIPNLEAGVSQDTRPRDVCGRTQMVDWFSMAATHELFEAMTDPTGKTWEDPINAFAPEIGDKCPIPTFTCGVTLNDGSTWRLQYMWSNAAGGCVLGTP